MSDLLSPEGSLALAIAVLAIVLGYRFTLPERARDLGGFLTFALAIALGFAAGRGLVPGAQALPAPLPARLAGAVLLLAGLALAGSSSKARLQAGRGLLASGGPYARLRHPLYLGLSLVLMGCVVRAPSAAGVLAAVVAVGQYSWLGAVEEREAAQAFGAAWASYASRTRALVPLRRRRAR